jgi:hypothetical protein
MVDVHLYLMKLFGCMLAEAKANGYDLPIDLEVFSTAIMSGRPHAEVHLQFGRCDGTIGRLNLHCWKTDPGESVLAGCLYELDTIAVSVMYVQAGRFEHRRDIWQDYRVLCFVSALDSGGLQPAVRRPATAAVDWDSRGGTRGTADTNPPTRGPAGLLKRAAAPAPG